MLVSIDREIFGSGEISFASAVRIAYKDDLDWIESMLRAGLSVLIKVDKSLSLPCFVELRNRLRTGSSPLPCILIKSPPSSQSRSFLHAMVGQLWEQLESQLIESNSVVVLPHIDLLANDRDGGLGNPAREAIAAMSQDPSLRFLGFCDPSLHLPRTLANIFDVQREITGIRREHLPRLLSYQEAQRFGVTHLNLLRLYKYVSGLNAIKLRKLMARVLEFPPMIALPPEEREAQLQRVERVLREMTLLGGMEIPNVDLMRDVGGYDEVKKRLYEEIIDILALREEPTLDAEHIRALEETLPKGILLHGPPGTGKTYIAKAFATAIQATTLVVSGPEIKSKWVGETEANLRHIFAQARAAAPALIIFDELDAIAPRRGMYAGSGVEHSLVNQLLTEMDGFRKEELVFVVATTNFVESLDPALLRPGRFEYQIHIPYPDRIARQKIIEIYARHFNMSYDDICLEYLLERTGAYIDAVRDIRYSGDHLYGIARQLKRLQARRRDQRRPFPVTCADIDEVMGPSLYRNPQKRLQSKHKSAYHEAGHALAAALLLEPQAIHKVTIAAEHPHVEGMISIHGYVSEAASQSTLLALIQIALAGRTAEQMIFGQLDIGAKNDLDFATELARMMVEDLGMSEQFGPRVYRLQNGVQHAVGGVTRERIDNEINQILITQSQKVAQLLEKHAHHLEQIAKTLLSNTEIDGQQLAELLNLSDPTTTNTE